MGIIKTALLVIDVQNEFIKGNKIVPYGESIINNINNAQNLFDNVFFTKNIYKKIENTDNSELYDGLNKNKNIFIRDYQNHKSALQSKNNNNEKLIDVLCKKNITYLFISGLPGEYPIKYTTLESINFFKTYIILDAIKTLNDINLFISSLISENNISFTNTKDLKKLLLNLKNNDMFYKENSKLNDSLYYGPSYDRPYYYDLYSTR